MLLHQLLESTQRSRHCVYLLGLAQGTLVPEVENANVAPSNTLINMGHNLYSSVLA